MKKKSFNSKNKHEKLNIFMFLIVFFFTTGILTTIPAQKRWTAEVYGGIADNFRTPLVIQQTGYPDIRFTAGYYTRSLELPIYYGYRIGTWYNKNLFELELNHHKIYLFNNPPEVTSFNVSHGINMLTLNYGKEYRDMIFKFGAGTVIAHPEFKIRDVSFDNTRGLFKQGYMPGGIALNLAVAHQFRFSKRFFLNTEFKTTFAYTKLTQDNLTVKVYNAALHFCFGPGYNMIIRDK